MAIRIYPLDYLKCIFIVLMIVFHLTYIGDKYPYIKQIVYTFHMPAFLIISGYLTNIQKKTRRFVFSMIWIFVPYSIMETGYVLMSAVLPVRKGVREISQSLLLNKVFIAPMGPYWYLHTLIICNLIYYIADRVSCRMNQVTFIILLETCYWFLSDYFQLLSMANAVYFMIGIVICRSKQSLLSVFQPSILGIFPLVLLCQYPENLNRFTMGGAAITYLFISLSLWVYFYIPDQIKRITHFVGSNTLPILLFSPIFTIVSKGMIPLFSFDDSGLCFMCVATAFVIFSCVTVAWCMDKMNLSRWFCGRISILNNWT